MTTLRNFTVIGVLLVGLSAVAGAQENSVKVGFINVGRGGDFGWSHQHDQGRLALEATFGDTVETTLVESVPEVAVVESMLRQLAEAGNDLIFMTSPDFMNLTLKVARQFPDVKFEHVAGYQRAENVSTYASRSYEGRHVIGLIAGQMTGTNIIGYIGAYPIPRVIRGINAAYLAAKSVNPDIELRIVWTNTWYDPGLEADAANTLIEQGADVLMQHTDSAAAMTIAEEQGIVAFGQASNMIHYGPEAQLTAIIDEWAPYYIQRVQDVMEGTWQSTETWGGIGAGMVEFAPLSDRIPPETQEQALAAAEAIAAGTLHPFTGPINRQDGSLWLEDGEEPDDKALLEMNFYVEGIDGAIPQ